MVILKTETPYWSAHLQIVNCTPRVEVYHDDLRGLSFPMLADTSKTLSRELGILTEGEEVCYRATYIVDPQGIIRFVSVKRLVRWRNVNEWSVYWCFTNRRIMPFATGRKAMLHCHRKLEMRFERWDIIISTIYFYSFSLLISHILSTKICTRQSKNFWLT